MKSATSAVKPEVPAIPKLLTIEQVSQLFGVSSWTIRYWQKEGRLKATKIGRLVRFEEAEVARFVASGRSF